MSVLPQFFRSITCSLQCKETCGLTVLLGLFCQAGISCEIHLAVFRQGNKELCSVYLLFLPMQSHHKMLQNQSGVDLYSLPISVSDNIQCKAVKKFGLLKKLIRAKHQFACHSPLVCMHFAQFYTKAFRHQYTSPAASHAIDNSSFCCLPTGVESSKYYTGMKSDATHHHPVLGFSPEFKEVTLPFFHRQSLWKTLGFICIWDIVMHNFFQTTRRNPLLIEKEGCFPVFKMTGET